MKKFGFITNKYAVSVLLLLCLLLTDIVLHRGMSRVILPASFSDKIKAVNLPVCKRPLVQKDKHWIKVKHDTLWLHKIPANTAGIEMDVVFNALKKSFEVYPDSSFSTTLYLDSMLLSYSENKLQSNIWLAFKNLNPANTAASLQELIRLRNKYQLANQVIIESPVAASLKSFCDSGFFTAYAVPFFNPYQAVETEIIHFTDSIRNSLSAYPASAVSATYYQYPVLKKFFPNYPILTRADNVSLSVVSYVFKRQLENEENIKVILYPFKD